MSENLLTRIQSVTYKIQNNQYISAITNALMALLPITIIGSLCSLINALPIDAYQTFLNNSGLKLITSIPNSVTNNLLALYAVFLVTQKFVGAHEIDGTPAGLISLMAFLIVTPYNLTKSGSMESLSVSWFGAAGLFTAFIVALVVGKIYVVFQARGWTIKMPEGVPPAISKSFSALIPSFVVVFLMSLIRFVFGLTSYGSIHSFIFKFISTPLTMLGSSLPAVLVAIIVMQVLWLFGIHGYMIVFTVFQPIWSVMETANLAAYNSNQAIPYIVSKSLFSQAMISGSGMTIGLVVAMLFAKSKQYKAMGKIAIIPNIFGINEPVIYGTPIVMNFRLAIPFITVPLVSFLSISSSAF